MQSNRFPAFAKKQPLEGSSNDHRTALWLRSPYPAPIWEVCDTWNTTSTESISFDYMLADGRSLLQAERLYATVKEFAFYARDERFSAINDAYTHSISVRNLMHITHAMSLRGLFSFAHLQPFEVAELVEEVRYGVDAVLHAAERVELYLDQLARKCSDMLERGETPPRFGGLPFKTYKNGTNVAVTLDIVAACNLPSAAAYYPCVTAVIRKAAAANGLHVNQAKSDATRPTSNTTSQSMLRWLAPLEQLYAMRRHIQAESISFKPFPLGAAKVATVKGVATERTPIPPPRLVLHLLEYSARQVLDYDCSTIETAGRETALKLATACWINIATFSARRDDEIDNLKVGCIRGSPDEGYWLHTYIGKTLQRMDLIPVPSLVAASVDVLTKLSATARSETGKDDLFIWRAPNGEIHRIDVGRSLDKFAAAVGTPLHREANGTETVWHWHPHQFRRFFAVLYFYRFEGANIESLAYFLRHFSLEMTKRYITQDPEVAALWTDVEWGYMGHVARSIAAGERVISGGAGERLKKLTRRLIDLFRRKVQVVSPDRIGASLLLIMQRDGMVLTPKPWVTCTCPQTAAAAVKAACRKFGLVDPSAVGPDFARAGPSVCNRCPHAIAEQSKTSFISAEITHLEVASSNGNRQHSIFGQLEAARVIELRHFRDFGFGTV